MQENENKNKKEVARLDSLAKDANAVIDQMQHATVKGYLALGQALLQLRPLFPGHWEKHLKDLGIDETRWKRAKAIAEHFKDAKELEGFSTIDDALKKTRWGRSQRQNKGTKPRTPQAKPVARKGATSKPGKASAFKAQRTSPAKEDDAKEEMEATQPPITPEELAAVNTYVKAVGGWDRAVYVIEEGYKKWKQNLNG
jgi:hypothetical protein